MVSFRDMFVEGMSSFGVWRLGGWVARLELNGHAGGSLSSSALVLYFLVNSGFTHNIHNLYTIQ